MRRYGHLLEHYLNVNFRINPSSSTESAFVVGVISSQINIINKVHDNKIKSSKIKANFSRMVMGDYYYNRSGGRQEATANKDFRTYPDDKGGIGGGGMEIVNYNPYRPRSPDRVPVSARKSTSSQSGGSIWGFNDPETKRRRRVASYKAYSVEGRVKASIRTGFRWIKTRCSQLVHGW